MKNEPLKPATIAAQAAGAKDTATGGVVPGISLATTYTRDADYALLRPDNMYGRDQNDTVRQAEEVIRQLEGAAATLLFPSGMAAVAAVFRALPSGARVVMQTGIYWGTLKWVRAYCVRRRVGPGVPGGGVPVFGGHGLDRDTVEPVVENGRDRHGGGDGA